MLEDRTFVGRAAELAEMQHGLDEAVNGQGRLFLLAGEPGIGKTRLADEVATAARGRGALVLWGRSWESGGAPAYWPWTQIVRAVSREAHLADEARHLLTLLAPTRDVGGSEANRGVDATPAGDFEQARFSLFDTVTSFLHHAAQQRPLVMILDDVHASDLPSLLLLRFVARELRSAPWLIVATYRELEVSGDPPRHTLLGEIAREGRLLKLQGLSRADVDCYIRSIDFTEAPAALANAVYGTTEGNPLFVTEVLQLIARDPTLAAQAISTPTALAIPDPLRAIIRRRFVPLSDAARHVLGVAAVIGREFDLPVLERAVESEALGDVGVLTVLDEACRVGLVSAQPNSVGRYTFSHALIRETLYDDLGPSTQARRHRAVGNALETVWRGDLAPHWAEMAHHFCRAAADGDVDAAVAYAQQVGTRAQSLLAYEEAVKHFEQALAALRLRAGGPALGDARLRCEILLALGDAQWGAGNLVEMRATFQRAAEVARGLAAEGPSLLARAALGMGGRQQRSHAWYDDDLVRLLEEALIAFEPGDSPLRARVMARLAYALYLVPGSYDRRRRLCEEAVQMARRVGEPRTLRWVLNDWRWALWGPSTSDDRTVVTSELLELAERTGDRELALIEHTWRLVDMLERADIAALDAELARVRQLAGELRRPWFLSYVGRFEAMQAMLEGRFEDCERFAEESLAVAQRVKHDDAVLIYSTVLLTLRMVQGRLPELEAGVQAFVASYPSVPIWQSVLAFVHAEAGRVDQARAEFERIASQDFRNLPRDYLMLPAAAYLCEVCAFLDDGERAAQLYEIMEPYRQRLVVIGFGVASLGAVARYLGLLAETMQRWDLAVDHYEAALAINERMRARPATAQAQCDYARVLLRAPAAALSRPVPAATALLEQAERTAQALGMAALTAKIAGVGPTMAGGDSATATPRKPRSESRPQPAGARVFRRQGDFWTLQFDGAPFQLPDLLGLRYVVHLLRHPRQEFHVTDLVDLSEKKGATAVQTEAMREASIRADLGDAGPLLDAQAKHSYKARLRDLREELSEAESLNDLGRVDALRREMDALTQELAGAVGLGGRSRRAASHAERARVSVTKRIGIALKRIRTHDPAFAHYLAGTLKTGAFCSYNPDPGRDLKWSF